MVIGRPRPTEPIDVVCRYATEDIRKFLPPRLQALFDDDRRRTVAESLCVLYVAMTRAVHCLHMIVPPPKANEKSLPKTYAGLLRATLGSGLASTAGVVLRAGRRAVVRAFGKPSAASCACRQPTSRPPRIRLRSAAAARERGLERTSPSALEGGRKVSAARLLGGASRCGLRARHARPRLDGALHWLDDGLPDDATLLAVAARAAPAWPAIGRSSTSRLATFRQQLAAPQIAAALSPGRL